jgi:hypothetical protein
MFEELSFSQCDRLSHQFTVIARLKTIDLHNCYSLTDEAFKCLETPLLHLGSSLHSMNLSNVYNLTSKSISRIASACKELTHLSLAGVPKVGDDGIVPLARTGALRELDLSARMLGMTCSTSSIPRVGPRGIIEIGQYCTNLRVLRLNECSRIDDLSLMVLARGCTRIEEISLRRCYKIGDKSLSALGKHCHIVRNINLSACKDVTDEGIDKLANGCRDLVEIHLSNLRITDKGIDCLSSRCRKLVTIVLQNCYRITDSSLSKLLDNCTLLEKIDLKGADLITDHSFQTCYLPYLTLGAFGGSAISEETVNVLAKNSLFCKKVKGKSTLLPIYPAPVEQTQHRLVSVSKFNFQLIAAFLLCHH